MIGTWELQAALKQCMGGSPEAAPARIQRFPSYYALRTFDRAWECRYDELGTPSLVYIYLLFLFLVFRRLVFEGKKTGQKIDWKIIAKSLGCQIHAVSLDLMKQSNLIHV